MRKNWKRLSALLLALVMVLSLVPVTALAARVEDDAVQIAAPETAVHEAKPAGAVDAAEVADVPAVLAEGEDDNIAQGKPVYVSGIEASTLMPAQGVDNNTGTHWGSSKMKNNGNEATAANAVSWFVVDLLDDDDTIAVDHITSITMKFNARVWPEACTVQVAKGSDVSFADYTEPGTDGAMKYSSDYAGTRDAIDNESWIPVAEFEKSSSDNHGTDQNIIMSTTYSTSTDTEIAPKEGTLKMEDIPEGVRYVRVYFTAINATSPGTCIGMKELEVMGTIKDIPPDADDDSNDFPAQSMTMLVSNAAADNSSHNEGLANYAKDGNEGTMWHTDYAGNMTHDSDSTGETRRWIGVDMGEPQLVRAIRYLHRTDKSGQQTHNNVGNGFVVDYKVQTSEDGTTWTDVEGASGTWNTYVPTGDDNSDPTVTPGWQIAVLPEPVRTRYVRLVGVKTNGSLGVNTHMHAAEIRVMLAEEPPVPTETKYWRQSGDFEAGTYLIHYNGYNLHNTDGAKTDQCTGTQPVGDTLALDHTNGGTHVATDHQWLIAGNATDGYTIQGVTENEQNYLTKDPQNSGSSTSQLKLDSNADNAVKVFFEAAGNGYKVFYLDGETKMYLRLSQQGSSRWWNFSTEENVVQFFKETTVGYSNTLSVKVVDDKGAGVSGATVTLAKGANYTVQTITATAGEDAGTYTFDISGLDGGTYYARASKAGYGTMINVTPIEVTDHTVADFPYSVTLTAIDGDNAKYKWSFDDSSSQPADTALDLGTGAVKSYEGGGMKLTWADSARANNLVRINKTNAKNCVVEFDATRNSGNKRFGLGVRMHTIDNATYWVYIGQFEDAGGWGGEIFKNTSSAGYSGGNTGPSFGSGETRHFKVTLNEGNVTLEIDGVTVINNQAITTLCGTSRNENDVSDDEIKKAGDVGFLYGNTSGGGACSVDIDNLYVFRNDPSNRVSWTDNTDNGTIAGTYTENGVTAAVENGTGDGISAGLTVTVTGTPAADSGKVLDKLTAKKVVGSTESELTETELAALNIQPTAENTFTFTMPAYSVKLEGTFLPKLTGVTIDETNGLKVGQKLTATAKVGETAASSGVTYLWYHQTTAGDNVGEGNWTQCTQTVEGETDPQPITAAERPVLPNDSGKKIKVVATGDGAIYAKTVSVEAVTTNAMAAADVGIESVSLNKSGTVDMNSGATLDVTATLTSAVAGKDYTAPQSIVWTSSSATVATVAANADNKQATVTAVGNGTATITVRVTDALGNEKSDSFDVRVTTKVTGITVSIPDGKDGTIYTNEDSDKTLQLTAAVVPDTASDKNVAWSSGASSVATVDDNGLVSAVGNGTAVITATADDGSGVTGTYTVTVKTKLKGTVSITIPAAGLKNGQTLTANVTNVTATGLNKDTQLTYKWYRGETAIEGATSKTYTLTGTDVNQTIKVEVGLTDDAQTAGYEGTVTSAATTTVGKKAGPAAPTGLEGTDCTSGNNGKISGLTAGTAYQISSNGTDWDDATVTSDGEITGLAAGTYYIRVKVADTNVQEEGASSGGITILAEGANAKAITVDSTITNGTVTVSKNKANENDTITITVTPDAGYQLVSDSLKVYKTGEETTTVTVNENNQFTMPDYAVTVTAQFEEKTYTITHNLGTNVTCDYGSDTEHRITHNTMITIQLRVTEGYELPAPESVTVTQAGDTTWNGYEYNSTTGLITIHGENVVNNLTVSCADAVKKEFAITDSLGPRLQCNLSTEQHKVKYGEDKEIILSVRSEYQTGYHMRDTISVTMNGQSMTLNPAEDESGYTYVVAEDGLSATLTLKKVTAGVTVTATAEQNKTAIESVSIDFSHHVEGVEGDAPHVGDTLEASVAPSNASVSYQWKRNGAAIDNATDANYTLMSADEGKTITVTVTGTGNYQGEKTSDPTGAVKAAYVVATGIELDQATATVAVDGTVTLNATVKPDNASDKTVTWTSSNSTIASVANGVVTGKKVGQATITATVAKNTELDAICTVTVTAPVSSVSISGELKVGQQLTANVTTPVGATVTYQWVRVAANNTETTITSATAKTYTLQEADKDCKIKVTVQGTGYYTGTASYTSENAVVGEDEQAPVETGALVTAIADAKKAKEGIETLPNGTEANAVEAGTKFVTTAELEALNTAIADAEEALADEDKTDATVAAAVDALNGAVSTFTAAVKTGTKAPVVTTALEEAIDAAKAAKKTAVALPNGTEANAVEAGTKFVTESEMGTLDDAIAAAEAALAKADKTEESVAAAVTALNNAVSAFEAATKPGTKTPVVTTELDDAIAAAEAKKSTTVASSANQVASGRPFVTQDVMDALTSAIDTAKTAKNDPLKTEDSVADAAAALNDAVSAFEEAVQTGTKQSSSSSRPSSSTSTVTNPDGSVTTTTTKPDGTKVETTEKPDGTKETVETKKDGTVIETTEKPDGTTESVKTQPDGTVVETVVAPDGTKESVMTQPDGTVTETVIDTEGAMTEKVTDPEENVTITVTDPEGEELAKVEIPAEIAEPETKFDDAVDHWAEESINKIAALGLVNGVGDNKYGTESSLTRGQLATVLYRLSNGKSGYRVSFSDVELGQYYTEGVAWAAKAKVVNGYTADIFAPDDVITREQLAVMLCRYAKLIGLNTNAKAESLNAFGDGASTSAWAVDGVAWCVENGILKGMGNDVLSPTANVTRAQVAVMLDRFLGLIK